MFKISEFSHLVRISPRMLRHYEKCGLLLPAQTDKFNGYRQYSAGQIPLAKNIVLLRDLGFSIEEMAEVLPRMGEPVYLSRMLSAKADSVQAVINTEQAKLDRLLEMSDTMRKEQNIMVHEVELRKVAAVKVLSLRGIIPKYNEEYILWERLGKYIGENNIECHEDGYSTYFDEDYKESGPDVEIAIPVDKLGESDGDFVYREYAEIPLAATLKFSGPFDGGYDAASEKLARWMEDNGYAFAGPLRGHVIEIPGESGGGLTELQAPVVKK